MSEPVAYEVHWKAHALARPYLVFANEKPSEDWTPQPVCYPLYRHPSEDEGWKNVAMRLGEFLSKTGPEGYCNFTPDQWLDWAKSQLALSDEQRSAIEAAREHFELPSEMFHDGPERAAILRSMLERP